MIRAKFDLKDFKKFAALLKNTDYYKIMKIGMRAAMMKAHEIVIDEYLSAPGRLPAKNPYDTKLRRDSGITAATVGTRVRQIGKRLHGQIFSGQKHMPAHEFGATIRKRGDKGTFEMPKRAPFQHGVEAALPSMENILLNIYEKKMKEKAGF